MSLGALVLGTVAFAGLGLLIAGTLRAEATLALANLLFLVFLVLGGIVLPLDRLPDAVAQVAAALPAAALTQALAIGLGHAQGDAGPALALLAGWARRARGARGVAVPLGLTAQGTWRLASIASISGWSRATAFGGPSTWTVRARLAPRSSTQARTSSPGFASCASSASVSHSVPPLSWRPLNPV